VDEKAQPNCLADNSAENLWQHVQACPVAEASKALEIRLALEGQLGKQEARRLLAHARATVAKDASGHKNRILRVGGAPIRLIPSVPDGAGS
jgi:hypothetical protein